MSRPTTMPEHDFAEMNAEAIAERAEKDIKSLARKWKYRHKKATKEAKETAATANAALYLQANPSLYKRETIQATRDAHQEWMDKMRGWFLSVWSPRPRKGS